MTTPPRFSDLPKQLQAIIADYLSIPPQKIEQAPEDKQSSSKYQGDFYDWVDTEEHFRCFQLMNEIYKKYYRSGFQEAKLEEGKDAPSIATQIENWLKKYDLGAALIDLLRPLLNQPITLLSAKEKLGLPDEKYVPLLVSLCKSTHRDQLLKTLCQHKNWELLSSLIRLQDRLWESSEALFYILHFIDQTIYTLKSVKSLQSTQENKGDSKDSQTKDEAMKNLNAACLLVREVKKSIANTIKKSEPQNQIKAKSNEKDNNSLPEQLAQLEKKYSLLFKHSVEHQNAPAAIVILSDADFRITKEMFTSCLQWAVEKLEPHVFIQLMTKDKNLEFTKSILAAHPLWLIPVLQSPRQHATQFFLSFFVSEDSGLDPVIKSLCTQKLKSQPLTIEEKVYFNGPDLLVQFLFEAEKADLITNRFLDSSAASLFLKQAVCHEYTLSTQALIDYRQKQRGFLGPAIKNQKEKYHATEYDFQTYAKIYNVDTFEQLLDKFPQLISESKARDFVIYSSIGYPILEADLIDRLFMQDKNGRTLFHYIMQEDSSPVISFLLNRCHVADITQILKIEDNHGMTFLHVAAASGDADKIAVLRAFLKAPHDKTNSKEKYRSKPVKTIETKATTSLDSKESKPTSVLKLIYQSHSKFDQLIKAVSNLRAILPDLEWYFTERFDKQFNSYLKYSFNSINKMLDQHPFLIIIDRAIADPDNILKLYDALFILLSANNIVKLDHKILREVVIPAFNLFDFVAAAKTYHAYNAEKKESPHPILREIFSDTLDEFPLWARQLIYQARFYSSSAFPNMAYIVGCFEALTCYKELIDRISHDMLFAANLIIQGDTELMVGKLSEAFNARASDDPLSTSYLGMLLHPTVTRISTMKNFDMNFLIRLMNHGVKFTIRIEDAYSNFMQVALDLNDFSFIKYQLAESLAHMTKNALNKNNAHVGHKFLEKAFPSEMTSISPITKVLDWAFSKDRIDIFEEILPIATQSSIQENDIKNLLEKILFSSSVEDSTLYIKSMLRILIKNDIDIQPTLIQLFFDFAAEIEKNTNIPSAAMHLLTTSIDSYIELADTDPGMATKLIFAQRKAMEPHLEKLDDTKKLVYLSRFLLAVANITTNILLLDYSKETRFFSNKKSKENTTKKKLLIDSFTQKIEKIVEHADVSAKPPLQALNELIDHLDPDHPLKNLLNPNLSHEEKKEHKPR